ncbi:hypothetical protein OFAG_02185 [Oxalobacter formigenes HOxBLS]|uniref:Uncharacterized protein n=1 Tax=Oxalobacter paraformigenes TaxID=556268 RepID=T5LT89_9BURK|nr:hypothetical protein OFAG_02185 [Oxalobacter paraformigenes]
MACPDWRTKPWPVLPVLLSAVQDWPAACEPVFFSIERDGRVAVNKRPSPGGNQQAVSLKLCSAPAFQAIPWRRGKTGSVLLPLMSGDAPGCFLILVAKVSPNRKRLPARAGARRLWRSGYGGGVHGFFFCFRLFVLVFQQRQGRV